jgi:predicted nucleotidyltransferase
VASLSPLSATDARRAAAAAARLLAVDPRVHLVFLFGSAVRGVMARDVDLAVQADPPFTLEERVARQADLTAAIGAPIDLVPLEDASVALRYEVAETGVCLSARTPDAATEFVIRSRALYWDFRPFLDEQWRLAGERTTTRHGA